MNRSPLLLLFSFFCLLLTASRCKKPDPDPPVPSDIHPCFTLQNDTFMDPRQPVQFLNCTQGATSYVWDFGDGSTSTEASPTHHYGTVGYYNVALTAKANDDQVVCTKRIRVDYPRVKWFKVLQMPAINPHDGLPWDNDGSGLDFRLVIKYDGWPGHYAYVGPWLMDIPLQYPIYIDRDIPITNAEEFLVLCRYADQDTVSDLYRSLEELIDSPVETVTFPANLAYEIIMEGAR